MMMPRSRGRMQISPSSPSGSGALVVVDDLHLRVLAHPAGRAAFAARVVGPNTVDGAVLGHREHRGGPDPVARPEPLARDRARSGTIIAMRTRWSRSRGDGRLLPDDVGHGAERVEHASRRVARISSQNRLAEKPRRQRDARVGPERGVDVYQSALPWKSGQAGVEDVVGPVAEVDAICRPTAWPCECGDTTPFDGPVVPDVYMIRCGSECFTSSISGGSAAVSSPNPAISAGPSTPRTAGPATCVHPLAVGVLDADAARSRTGREVGQQVALGRGVQRDRDRAELAEAPHRPQQLGPVVEHQRDVVAAPDARPPETFRVAVGDRVRVGVGEPLPSNSRNGRSPTVAAFAASIRPIVRSSQGVVAHDRSPSPRRRRRRAPTGPPWRWCRRSASRAPRGRAAAAASSCRCGSSASRA